jgi:DNA-binding winged helix-turn-helix (wHTH) protein
VDLGGVRFEPESGELTGSGGRTARLAPQPASLLALLAAEPGRVVTRETIAEHLWPHGSVEVDQGIGYAMREVRKGLEAVGGDPAMIETIPRKGFRVRRGASSEEGLPADTVEPDAPVRAARARPSPFRLVVLAAITVVGGVALVLADRPRAAIPVLAIFEHGSSGDGAGARLAGSLGATLTTRITQDLAGRAGVVGPTGTASLAGPGDTDGARATLGACLVLSGALDVLPDSSVVVFTQLVRTSDRLHVWASTDTVPVPGAVDRVVPGILEGVGGALRDCGG